MAYDYRDLLVNARSIVAATSTISTLIASVTADYPISSDNIANRVIIGDPFKLPSFNTEYPRVYFRLIGKDEEFSELGTRSLGSGTTTIRRDVTVSIDVYAFAYNQLGSDDSDKAVQMLSRNIETLFRDNTQVQGDNGWDTMVFKRVDFADAYHEGSNEDIYLSAVRLQGEFKKYAIS